MLGNWIADKGYIKTDSFLVLSGGDMLTGKSISTYYDGRSTVEVMNTMGYDAAALGNHEFDFSVDPLLQRTREMHPTYRLDKIFRDQPK